MNGIATRPPVFKTVLIGEGGVGKTSITLRYTEDRFDESMKITIGANFASKQVNINGLPLTLMIWDLGGQPRFRDVVVDYFKGAKLAIAVYDVTRSYTLERLQDWISRLQESTPNCDLLLVGNKADGRDNGSGVSFEEGIAFAEKYNALYLEVSAKTGQGIADMFDVAAQIIMQKQSIAGVVV